MANIAKETIDEIRQKANIVDVIRHYIPVTQKGNGFVAVCPFHNDHDPSLRITPEKQIYHCFVCQKGGSVFQFVQDFEKVSFPEAVEKVGDLVGVSVSVSKKVERVVDPKQKRLEELMSDVQQYLSYSLKTKEASAALDYLKQRGITGEMAERFGIGYNPKNQLFPYLKAKGYLEQEMVEVNVCRFYQGKYTDVFQERICFPIQDRVGNTIAYTARSLDPQVESKYINTDSTPLFQKGKVIYNYHRAKLMARRQGKVILCEGVMDVIAFAKAGIENAVCSLGTACTIDQMRLLSSLAPVLVIAYDGDQAGQNASLKAARLAQEIGLEVRIIRNPSSLDPDEIFQKEGSKGLENYLKQEQLYLEFLMDYSFKDANSWNYSQRKKVAMELSQEIQHCPDEQDRRYFQKQLEERLGFELEWKDPIRKETKRSERIVVDGLELAEYEILLYLLSYPKAVQLFDEELGYLLDSNRNEVALTLVNHFHRHQPVEALSLLEQAEKEQERRIWTTLIEKSGDLPEFDEGILRALFNRVKISRLEGQIKEIYQSLQQSSLDEVSRKLLLEKYGEYKRALGQIKTQTDK